MLCWASQGFGLEHCKGVVEVLRVAGPRLKSLDLSDNGLNDRFAESLAEGLASSLLQEIEYAFFFCDLLFLLWFLIHLPVAVHIAFR